MIASVKGTVLAADGERAVIEVGGLGLEVLAAGPTLSALSRQVGEEARLHTYLHVREDALQLFGFRASREREFFLALIAVSGVGPKVALAVLSGYPVDELATAVALDDVKKFESIPGIGKKLAQRLVIELKDKVGAAPLAGSGQSGAGRCLRRRRRPAGALGAAEPRPHVARGRGGAQGSSGRRRPAGPAQARPRSEAARMSEPLNRIGDPQESPDELDVEVSLRPKRFADFVGQHAAKEQLEIFVQAAKNRGDTLDHVLLAGPPGLGKTTLAGIIAIELGVSVHTTSGPALERKVDVAGLLTNLQRGDVLFVDEIHRLNAAVEEVLYPAMEDYEIDIMIGEGPAARSIRMQVQPFTLIGATTRTGLLTTPLRDRFGVWQRLEYYEVEELAAIVKRSAGILKVADRSRLVPRDRRTRARHPARRQPPAAARARLRRGAPRGPHRASTSASPRSSSSRSTARASTSSTATSSARSRRSSTAVRSGLDTLAVALGEEADTLQDVYEPYLIMQGFLKRTPRGRVLTRTGFAHCGLTPPAPTGTLFDERLSPGPGGPARRLYSSHGRPLPARLLRPVRDRRRPGLARRRASSRVSGSGTPTCSRRSSTNGGARACCGSRAAEEVAVVAAAERDARGGVARLGGVAFCDAAGGALRDLPAPSPGRRRRGRRGVRCVALLHHARA